MITTPQAALILKAPHIARKPQGVLVSVPEGEWREPSAAQPKDQLGNQNYTCFVIRGWREFWGPDPDFGVDCWQPKLVHEKWYRDRDEFDHDLWRISVEEPYQDVFWYWAVVQNLTTGAGSNQTWNKPGDFNDADNRFETLAGAASGAAIGFTSARHATGGGGGAWSDILNHSTNSTETYQCGLGGTSKFANGAGESQNGVDGGDTWFGATTYASCWVGAKGGIKGVAANGNANGGAGGSDSLGVGTNKRSGGRGGNLSGASGLGGSGGGGAAGRNAAGSNGVDSSATTQVGTNGGTGDGGSGGSAGSGGSNANGTNGGNSTNMGGTLGPGGGGGGCSRTDAVGTAGSGGNYGGAGGGAAGQNQNVNSGAGIQGCIVVTYTPPTKGIPNFRKPIRFYRRAA